MPGIRKPADEVRCRVAVARVRRWSVVAASTGRSVRVRDARALIGASAVSQLGDWLYKAVLLDYVYAETGSAGWVGATWRSAFLEARDCTIPSNH
jgi:anti-sigma factor RsiW